ncbi:hypothetical protein [Terriglobus sp. RCC_193]|uniref:hypothetical protein n=1 Tax=Terriglobus sp. RCC_193 TaxID=3239218 RepID=UPI0035242314
MDDIQTELANHGTQLDAIYFSSFHPEHGGGEYRPDMDCPEPASEMILRVAEHPLDLQQTVPSDRCADIAGEVAAGTRPVLFGETETDSCQNNVHSQINLPLAIGASLRQQGIPRSRLSCLLQEPSSMYTKVVKQQVSLLTEHIALLFQAMPSYIY